MKPRGNAEPNRDRDLVSTLVVIGASVRAAAESACLAGYRVVGMDHFGDLDTIAACEKYISIGDAESQTAMDYLAALPTGTPILRVGGMEHDILQLVIHQHSNLVPLHCSPDPTFHHLARYCRDTSVQFPTSLPMTMDIPSDDSQWLFKRHGSGGGGMDVVDSLASVSERTSWQSRPKRIGIGTMEDQSPANPSWYRQRRVVGNSIGVTAFADRESVCLLGFCRSKDHRIGDRPFIYCGSTGPFALPGPLQAGVLPVAQNFACDRNWRGCFNLDLMVSGNEIYLLEINSRYSSSMELMERTIGRSLIAATIAANTGSPMTRLSPVEHPSTWDKTILYAKRAMTVTSQNLETLVTESGSLHDVPAVGTVVQVGQPICTRISRCHGPLSI